MESQRLLEAVHSESAIRLIIGSSDCMVEVALVKRETDASRDNFTPACRHPFPTPVRIQDVPLLR